jgi:hypothetical protein
MELYRHEIFLCIGGELSVLLCHLINCYLHFAKIVFFVGKMVFEDISLFLEAGRRIADAVDAGDQTFRYTFESMGWMTARWHEVQVGVCGFCMEIKLDIPVRKCACGIQKRIFGSRNSHSKLDEIVERIGHIDKTVEAFTSINPLHFKVNNETSCRSSALYKIFRDRRLSQFFF